MLLACALLFIAILGGTMLTFLFDQSAPRAARITMGASIGLPMLASIGFLFALGWGLNAWNILLSAAIMLLPFLLLIKTGYRSHVLAQFWPAAKMRKTNSPRRGSKFGYVFFYAAILVLLGLVFNRAVFERPDGIFTGIENNLGDLPLHLQVINSFTQGQNIPPEDPTYAGVRFAYPFLVDFLAAMLVRAGAGVIGAMWLQNMVMALALVGSLHYWTLLLTQNRLAGLLAPLLVLFSGGLGWWLLFSDFGGAEGTFTFLAALPHDYTILREPDTILRWGNSLTTLFVPQRSILFGAPLAIFIFCQWWSTILQEKSGSATATEAASITALKKTSPRARRNKNTAPVLHIPRHARMISAAIFAGLLPLIHAHTFLVVMGMAACLTLIFRSMWRSWLLFFAIAIPISLPEIFWLAHTGGVNARNYIGWQPGWDHGTHNVLWFWFVNAGPFLLALLAVLFWRRPNLRLPQTLIKFYAPFALCFIVPNLIKLAPWVWDNIKVLFWWYIASAPLVALLLAKWWQQRSRWRWLVPVAFLTMVLAGGLDVLRVITGTTEQQEFTAEGIAIAKVISGNAAPRATVLHAPTFDTPVFLTGRRSLLGFPGWMWSRGLDYSQRYYEIQSIYSGNIEANALLHKYQVDYVLVGPAEISTFGVNQEFLSQYKKLAEIGPYRLYQITQNEK